MAIRFGSIGTGTAYRGPAWYQEPYFQSALRGAMEEAAEDGRPLGLLITDVPVVSRHAAQAFFEFAVQFGGRGFIGLLGTGEFAITLPGVTEAEAHEVRTQLLLHLAPYAPIAGIAIFEQQAGPEALIEEARYDAQPAATAVA